MQTFIPLAAAAAIALVAAPSAAQTQSGQESSVTRATVLADTQASFKAIDSNGDGAVTRAELQAAQAKAVKEAEAARDSEIAATFKKLDTNGDGALSPTEFKAAARPVRVRTSPDEALAELDSNKDGKISLDEFRGPRLTAFDKADANHDGTVTAEELRAARQR